MPAPSPAQGVTLNVAAMAMTATPVASRIPVTVSATLAANEALAARRRRGESVLPLAFGEAGLPVHPALRAALAGASARNAYGPVAGLPCLREAAAGYWDRRGLPTDPAMSSAARAASRCSTACCWRWARTWPSPGRAG